LVVSDDYSTSSSSLALAFWHTHTHTHTHTLKNTEREREREWMSQINRGRYSFSPWKKLDNANEFTEEIRFTWIYLSDCNLM